MKKIIIVFVAMLCSTVMAEDVDFKLDEAVCTSGATSIQLTSSLGDTVAVTLLLDTKALGAASETSINLFTVGSLSYSLKTDAKGVLSVGTNLFPFSGWVDEKLSGTNTAPTQDDVAGADKASFTFLIGYHLGPIPAGHLGILSLEKEGAITSYYLNATNTVSMAVAKNFTINGDYVQEGWITGAPSDMPAGSTVVKYYIPMAQSASKEALTYVAVPEPATSMLSLLALVGLVGRRRR